MNNPVIQARQLGKTYEEGPARVTVLREIDLSIARAEMLAIVGASGSGKSTLLHLLGTLDSPSQGELTIDGVDPFSLNPGARGALRNEKLGFVYQFHHLLPEFTAAENVAMPLLIRRMARAKAMEQAEAMLEKVGLQHRTAHKPGEMSGGERQRAAIARALVTRPACLLADEPTGNLDHNTADSVFDLMLTLNREIGTALIIVTHDRELAKRTGRILHLNDGRLSEEAAA